MPDIVSPAARSRIMAGIRSKNTRPEIAIRSGLHRLGFRFLLHGRDLPGTPDIILPRWNAAVFVHGCFWHGHNCHLFKLPSTRTEFWSKKIARNRELDAIARRALRADGWRVLTIWECAFRKSARRAAIVVTRTKVWLEHGGHQGTIRGTKVPTVVKSTSTAARDRQRSAGATAMHRRQRSSGA
jgi:DNA mismatch endonuclease (patch repair protein)